MIIMCVMASAQADTFDSPIKSEGEIGHGWNMQVIQHASSKPFCQITKGFGASNDLKKRIGATWVLLMVKAFDTGGGYYVEIASDGFNVTDGNTYKGQLYFGRSMNARDLNGWNVEWKAAGTKHVGTYIVNLAVARFKQMNIMNPVVGRIDLGYFPLTGSSNAIDTLKTCVENMQGGDTFERKPRSGDTFS